MELAVKKVIFFFLPILCSSKLIVQNKPVELGDVYSDEQDSGPLWVFNLDEFGLQSLRLRTATVEEEDYFDGVVRPMIENFESHRPSVRVKKETKHGVSVNCSIEAADIKKNALIRAINKFSFSASADPDIYLTDFHAIEERSLSIYFKGPYTSLIVDTGLKRRLYFIPPPSPLPAWFYEEHSHATHVGSSLYTNAPAEIKCDFYEKLLNLLQKCSELPL